MNAIEAARIYNQGVEEGKRQAAQPAPVQPVASLKEVDVLMMAEAHGIDPSTKGLYGFYIDCISNQPAAQPAVPEGYVPISDDLKSVFIEGCGEIQLAWPPAAQPAPVPLTDEQKLMCWSRATHDADVEHKTEHQCLMDYGSEIEAAHGITAPPKQDVPETTFGNMAAQPASVQEILAAFPLFDEQGLDEEKHHCEWALLRDRKRLHAMLAAAPEKGQHDNK